MIAIIETIISKNNNRYNRNERISSIVLFGESHIIGNNSHETHLEPCRTYDIAGQTTVSLYTDIGTTDLRYRRSPRNYDIVSRY